MGETINRQRKTNKLSDIKREIFGSSSERQKDR